MADITNIEWADATFNPWEGCQKVSPGCDHCYAEARNARYGGGAAPNWGPGAPRRRTSIANWNKPLKWNREAAAFAEAHGRKQRVFCASLADVFDNAVEPQWRADLFDLIDRTPNLDWLLLTKRVGNVTPMLAAMGRECLPVHVMLGASIVNQEEADRDIPKLLATAASIRFLSMEPLLGPVDLSNLIYVKMECPNFEGDDGYGPAADPETGSYECCRTCDFTGVTSVTAIDWIIIGGESGKGARPMHPDWARSIRDQCAAAVVPFLFKQWGEWLPASQTGANGEVCCLGSPNSPPKWVGKKAAGRLLDGVTHTEFPRAA
jgi:protein gp37